MAAAAASLQAIFWCAPNFELVLCRCGEPPAPLLGKLVIVLGHLGQLAGACTGARLPDKHLYRCTSVAPSFSQQLHLAQPFSAECLFPVQRNSIEGINLGYTRHPWISKEKV